uniref:Uncharacterized protein n=1 Tax=Alexandrium monilatum TaxID=311494 RepID=A0A7S4V7T3_9DINO
MGNLDVEEVIERHVAALLLQGQGDGADESAQYRRAHVLPRVSPLLKEAVLQALPAPLLGPQVPPGARSRVPEPRVGPAAARLGRQRSGGLKPQGGAGDGGALDPLELACDSTQADGRLSPL